MGEELSRLNKSIKVPVQPPSSLDTYQYRNVEEKFFVLVNIDSQPPY
jgi:hypothetical protein